MKTAIPWQQAGISPDAIKQAMDRCDRMGRDAFRQDAHKGFKAAKGKRVMHEGRGPFEPRPLVAAAYAIGYPSKPRLGPKDFAGDKARQYLLRHQGFILEGGVPVTASEPTAPVSEQSVVLDGVSYPLSDLSEAARKALAKLHEADTAIKRLQQRLAIYQTARTAYAHALSDALPKAKH